MNVLYLISMHPNPVKNLDFVVGVYISNKLNLAIDNLIEYWMLTDQIILPSMCKPMPLKYPLVFQVPAI